MATLWIHNLTIGVGATSAASSCYMTVMLLLHISDIHFREPDCLKPALDPDRPYRTRLVQDVRARVGELGPVDALLIGGDVAFKGHPAEYETALAWIKELAEACGCPPARVYVIPGNHDVDRGVITRTPAVRNAHTALTSAAPGYRERELRTQFSDPDTGRSLLAPLAAYNAFAAHFFCQVYPPDNLYWQQDLPFNEHVSLRIFGLTSTLLSGAGGRDDTRESLYLSPLQTVLDPVDDIVNLVMCHHPPDWMMDQDEVDDAIRHRSLVHLFGHKHRQRITLDRDFARFSAGAVNPDRSEAGWSPGYNLIDLRISGEGRERVLNVEAHLLQWQTSPEQFRPVTTRDGDSVYRHTIPFPGSASSPARSSASPSLTEAAAVPATADELHSGEGEVEAIMSEVSTRALVFRFWGLSVSQRRDIALAMSLISRDELKLPEAERYGRALLRAGERGLLSDLAVRVGQKEARR